MTIGQRGRVQAGSSAERRSGWNSQAYSARRQPKTAKTNTSSKAWRPFRSVQCKRNRDPLATPTLPMHIVRDLLVRLSCAVLSAEVASAKRPPPSFRPVALLRTPPPPRAIVWREPPPPRPPLSIPPSAAWTVVLRGLPAPSSPPPARVPAPKGIHHLRHEADALRHPRQVRDHPAIAQLGAGATPYAATAHSLGTDQAGGDRANAAKEVAFGAAAVHGNGASLDGSQVGAHHPHLVVQPPCRRVEGGQVRSHTRSCRGGKSYPALAADATTTGGCSTT